MKCYRYSCDGGAIMIGNPSSRVCINNDFGDGLHCVYVYDDNDKFDSTGWDFKGTVIGDNINVYDYDCLHGDDLSNPDHILCILTGRYAVFVSMGSVVLEKWD